MNNDRSIMSMNQLERYSFNDASKGILIVSNCRNDVKAVQPCLPLFVQPTFNISS